MGKKCPDDIELEKYIYGDIFFPKAFLLKRHIKNCVSCRERLSEIKRFNQMLSSSSLEDPGINPPPELLQTVLNSAQKWFQDEPLHDNPNVNPVETDVLPSPPFRLRLALSGVLMALAWVFQWRLKGYFPGMALDTFFISWQDMKNLIDLFKTGFIWESLQSFFLALRTDGLSALGILGTTIPILFMSVIVCGAIVTVFFVKGIRSGRSGGERHEEII